LNSLLPHQGNTVHLDGEYDANIAQAVKSFQNSLDTKYLKMINEGNHKKISFSCSIGFVLFKSQLLGYHYYHLSGEIIGSVFTFAVYTVLFIIVLVVGYRKSRWIWLIVAIVTGLVILYGVR
jgi:glucan phosphoethanolaminetransferase (alkaline phosphatase superfamily)